MRVQLHIHPSFAPLCSPCSEASSAHPPLAPAPRSAPSGAHALSRSPRKIRCNLREVLELRRAFGHAPLKPPHRRLLVDSILGRLNRLRLVSVSSRSYSSPSSVATAPSTELLRLMAPREAIASAKVGRAAGRGCHRSVHLLPRPLPALTCRRSRRAGHCAPEMPETRYARSGDGGSIAYQVVGDGPFDVVLVPGFISHVELVWTVPLAR